MCRAEKGSYLQFSESGCRAIASENAFDVNELGNMVDCALEESVKNQLNKLRGQQRATPFEIYGHGNVQSAIVEQNFDHLEVFDWHAKHAVRFHLLLIKKVSLCSPCLKSNKSFQTPFKSSKTPDQGTLSDFFKTSKISDSNDSYTSSWTADDTFALLVA